SLVGDQDHGALLDRLRDLLRLRLRPVLPLLLPLLPELMAELPRRALVLGLARSGQAAALALARRDVQVIGVDRSTSLATGRLAQAGVEVRLGTEEGELLD